jgi:hypothetical protein
MRIVVAALLCMVGGPVWAAGPVSCGPAIAGAEKAWRTAPGLLGAIGLVESGRVDPGTGQRAPWPWTVTAEGIGTFYPGKEEAVRAVEQLRQRGVSSIDVGCMQVNLLHHPTAFRSLDEAFDPTANVTYAASFLASLHGRLGDWASAASAYHSMTPELGAQYGRLVAAVWAGWPLPVVSAGRGVEVVRFPGGGQMRMFRTASVSGPARVAGFLTGP